MHPCTCAGAGLARDTPARIAKKHLANKYQKHRGQGPLLDARSYMFESLGLEFRT